MKTKERFHKLIDEINDEELLKAYYELINKLNSSQSGEIWNSLTEEQKQELLLSYDESFNPENLISHTEVKKQHEKWLRK